MAAIEETLENGPLNRRAAFKSWKLLVAIVLALIVVVVVAIWIVSKRRGSRVERGTHALVETLSKRRLIEPRLSGVFKGGEFRTISDDASDIGSGDLDQARGLIMDAVAKNDPGAELAYARFLLSEGEKPDEARKYLRRAMASQPETAETKNDLGVCLIQQGKIEDAIETFDAALKDQTDMPEALFNRALCFQRLLLRDSASADYLRLLEYKLDPDWQKEISEREKAVSAPLSPLRFREIVGAFDKALANGNIDEARRITSENLEVVTKHASHESSIAYLKEAVAGDRERAAATLSKIEWIGDRFIEAKGDKSIADLAGYLRTLPDEQRERELELIGEYVEAEKLFNLQKYAESQPAFARLEMKFAERGNQLFQFFSAFCDAGCTFSSSRLEAGLAAFSNVLLSIEKRSWPYREALTLVQLGIAHSRLGYDSDAIKECEKALVLGKGLCFVEAKALQFLGNPYRNMGNLDRALASLRESTRLYLTSAPMLKELASNYMDIAILYSDRGNHSLAVLYSKQSLNYAQQINDSNRAAQASAFTAVEYARVKQADQAEEQLSGAFDYLKSTDKGLKGYTQPYVLTRAGEMAAQCGKSVRAVGYYSKAAARLQKTEGNSLQLMEVLRGRAEAYTQAGDSGRARKDLEHAVNLIEGYREGIADRKDRSNFLDASQSIFDQLIQLDITAFGRRDEAFDFSEQSRARTLLDDFSRSQSAKGSALTAQAKPLKLADVQKAIPEDLRLLSYSVTSERTYIFLITRTSIEVIQSPATTEILDRLVQDYVSAVRALAPVNELSEKSGKLYEYLIEPIKAQLEDGKRLCIVPDKALHFLPFSALIDPVGRYLLYYRMTYAPSASAFVRSVEESRAKAASRDETILAVGNPKFNRDRFPLLENLQDAESEASESAALYPHSLVLNGARATESEVVASLKECDVAHLAVHCLVEEKSPWLAALVLAGSDQVGMPAQSSAHGPRPSADDGMLYLNEVYGFTLPRTRLVVLSACQSGLGQYYRGEGIVSLVRPFLALRVPMVVASLWAINSQATSTLMLDFHRNRRAAPVNMEAGEALRLAQKKMAESGPYQHPFYWAPFIAVGSNN